MVSAAFRSIFALADPGDVWARHDEVTDTLEPRFPKAAASLRDARLDILAFSAFPRDRWRKIRVQTTRYRLIERINEIKRRSRVVGIPSNDASVIRLAGAFSLSARRMASRRPPLPL